MSEDPPRTDFDSATRARRPYARPEFVLGEDPTTARTAVAAGAAADLSAAYLGAHLRAYERYQGAIERESLPDARSRSNEAISFARDGAASLDNAANRLEELRAAVTRDSEEVWQAGLRGSRTP